MQAKDKWFDEPSTFMRPFHVEMCKAQLDLASVAGRLQGTLDQCEGRSICMFCRCDMGPSKTYGQHSNSHGLCKRKACVDAFMN